MITLENEICIIIYGILFIGIIFFSYKLIFWVYEKIYHSQHKELPKLNKKLLKDYLVNKYGKGGKNIYNEFKKELWNKFRIR